MKGLSNIPVCFIIIFVGFFIGRCSVKNEIRDSEPTILVKKIIIHDTIALPPPPPKYIKTIQREIVYIDSARLVAQSEMQIHSDTLGNVVAVDIPIKQSVYETDDYRAVISGYKASLDSMTIYKQTQLIRDIEIHNRNKRWGVGIQVGVGATRQGVSPYIGVGVQYSLFNF